MGAAGPGIQSAGPYSFRFSLDIHYGRNNHGDGSADEFDEVGFVDGDTDDIRYRKTRYRGAGDRT